MFPDHPCLSWFGGTGSVEHADLIQLQGRQIIIWPDADQPGRDAAAKLAGRLKTPRTVNTDGLPDSFDASDLVDDDPEAWLADRLALDPGKQPPPRGTAYGRLNVLGMDDLDTAPPDGAADRRAFDPELHRSPVSC